jgi:hypothetical protein
MESHRIPSNPEKHFFALFFFIYFMLAFALNNCCFCFVGLSQVHFISILDSSISLKRRTFDCLINSLSAKLEHGFLQGTKFD